MTEAELLNRVAQALLDLRVVSDCPAQVLGSPISSGAQESKPPVSRGRSSYDRFCNKLILWTEDAEREVQKIKKGPKVKTESVPELRARLVVDYAGFSATHVADKEHYSPDYILHIRQIAGVGPKGSEAPNRRNREEWATFFAQMEKEAA